MKKFKDYFELSTYIIFHPVAGFYSMKTEKKGKVGIIFINLFLFWISYSFQKQYAGFTMNENNPDSFNILIDFIMIAAVFLLWCLGNWSVTTLMNGEGSFKDIAMSTSYSLTPIIIVFIPATIISNFMVFNEKDFYYLVLGVAIIWSAMLMFVGILSIHNYTLGRTIITIILTFISVLIILFLIGLIFSLIQQVVIFCKSLYTELIYRL